VALPFVLSSYLRPFTDATGQRLYDNGITGRVEHLPPLQEAVVRALWDQSTAEAALTELLQSHPRSAVRDALMQLYERALVFDSHASCHKLFYHFRDARLPRVPFVDQVELTNRCPMRCRFCPRGVPGVMQRPQGFMDLTLFRSLLSQLHPGQARYRPLELHHLGESLLHPQVVDFVACASAHGLPTEMSVNPALLTPELGQRLCAAGLCRLVLSLDGTDEETLVKIRGPAARYSKAERHLQALLQTVAARGTEAPQVVIQMIALSANRHQREAFLQRYGSLGLPTVQAYIKPLDGDDPDLGEPTAEPLRYLCSYPFRSVVVLWDGRVVPCCRDDDARYVLGDLRTQTLVEIWQGPAAQELRQRHREDSFAADHLCADCAFRAGAFAAAHPTRHPDRAGPAPLNW
jgi:radical SAM protein with 4Fe4S-binding SPASM domain